MGARAWWATRCGTWRQRNAPASRPTDSWPAATAGRSSRTPAGWRCTPTWPTCSTTSATGSDRPPRSGQLGPHRPEDPLQQPRHLHLGDAEDLPDLALALVLDEPQVEDPPVALGQLLHDGAQRFAGVDEVGLVLVVGADQLTHRRRRLADGQVERRRLEAAEALDSLVELVLAAAHIAGELIVGRRTPELLGEVVDAAAD